MGGNQRLLGGLLGLVRSKCSQLVIIAILAEIALGIAWGVSFPADIPGGYAVVVGIEDYPGTANDLNYPAEDVQDTMALLVNMGFPTDTIICLKDSQATKRSIIAAIEQMAKRVDCNDVFFFYFSGHGDVDPSIVPYDAATAGVFTGSELAAALAVVPVNHQVCVFDSCFSGDLIPFLAKDGRCVISACAAGETSIEYGSLQNGAFTYYWVQSFTGPTGGSGYATVGAAFTWASPQVVTYTGNTQHPQINNQVAGGGVMNFAGPDPDDGVRVGLGVVFISGLVAGGIAVVVLKVKKRIGMLRSPATMSGLNPSGPTMATVYDLGPIGRVLFIGSLLRIRLNVSWDAFHQQCATAIETLSRGDQDLLRDYIQDPHDVRLLNPSEFRRFFASIAIQPPAEVPIPVPKREDIRPGDASDEWIPLDENAFAADPALNSSVITLLNETYKEAKSGNTKNTKRYLHTALNLCPKSLTCVHNASVLFLRTGMYKNAEKALGALLQIQETNARGWNMLGFALVCQERRQAALDVYTKAANYGKLDKLGLVLREKAQPEVILQLVDTLKKRPL